MADCVDHGQTSDSSLQNDLNTSDCHEDLAIAPECLKEASQIQAIDKASVHRICSGQVVLTLATAVKELVENSIDAGATSVEVRLKDYGSESIEVTDNGSGVEEKDFEGLTLKHHTSKLQDFDDLVNVTSFGFRGEALSSLCALSNMVIMTRHKSAAVGSRLEFDLNGRIITRKSSPRQVGTTVQVQNIFHSLPVRHKEFQRNLKKEFTKLVHVLNAYCLISTRVRISCTNQTTKGSRSTVVSTNGNESLRDNIGNVFGTKQLQSLLEFKQEEAGDDVCSDFGIRSHQKSAVNFRIEGYVSKCEHGQGRGSTDRQFIFINRRPCDHTKILKIINEVYHTYNRHQNPFIALNILVDKESVDVNVTPDKRQIFLEGENLLLATLKISLSRMFEPTTSIYKVNNLLVSTPSVCRYNSSLLERSVNSQDCSEGQDADSPSLASTLSRLKRSFSSAFAKSDFSESPASSTKSNSFPVSSNTGSLTHFFSKLSPRKSKSSTASSPPRSQAQAESKSYILKSLNVQEGFVNPDIVPDQEQRQCDLSCDASEAGHCRRTGPLSPDSIIPAADMSAPPSDNLTGTPRVDSCNCGDGDISLETDVISSQSTGLTTQLDYVPESDVQDELLSSKTVHLSSMEQMFGRNHSDLDGTRESEMNYNHELDEIFVTDLDLCQESHDEVRRREQNVPFCLASLRKRLHLSATNSESRPQFGRSFRAKICPTDNQSAESELQKEISKDMFDQMDIVGQFNLGFIITRLGRDLFIVDQHATDEKYNFEMLQRDTVLQSQKLIVPQNLELTASSEIILMDNLEVFKKNGFDFIIDPEGAPTKRVKLTSAPISKNWSFGKDDIEELLFMLSDAPNVMCWPSRVKLMFASRACRKSIMIGTALNKYEMKRLVSHMGQIEQPWNCPHGRPTMRHLFNLDMLPS